MNAEPDAQANFHAGTMSIGLSPGRRKDYLDKLRPMPKSSRRREHLRTGDLVEETVEERHVTNFRLA
jgi:hypothetical protein